MSAPKIKIWREFPEGEAIYLMNQVIRWDNPEIYWRVRTRLEERYQEIIRQQLEEYHQFEKQEILLKQF